MAGFSGRVHRTAFNQVQPRLIRRHSPRPIRARVLMSAGEMTKPHLSGPARSAATAVSEASQRAACSILTGQPTISESVDGVDSRLHTVDSSGDRVSRPEAHPPPPLPPGAQRGRRRRRWAGAWEQFAVLRSAVAANQALRTLHARMVGL